MKTRVHVGLALSCLQALHAATYVVSIDGNDRNDGSEAAPFRTISHAVEVMGPGDVCLVRAGTYRETVRPARSGREAAPIVIRNWPGERPRVVGFDPIDGWTRMTETIWQAPLAWDLGKNNQVFINGRPSQEARWPHKTNDDPLDWEAASFDTGSTNEFLLCSSLPDHPDGYWKGAILWVMAGAKWTSWSRVVDDYVAAEKKLVFGLPPDQGSIARNMSPADRRGGVFYLLGHRGALDAPGEWHVDRAAKTVSLCLQPDQDPSSLDIAAKRRLNAFDISERQHVHVIGFDVVGATLNLERSEHCLVQDIRATWISHTHGGDTGYSLNENLGVVIGGSHNTLRDSEIGYSAGNGVKLSGSRHAVVNCWIHHTDYTGSYDAPVKIWGTEMLVSHNTIHDTGRDCLQPSGQGHIIEFNDIFNMGRLAHDLGGSYVCGTDGGGTEFRFNWYHDNLAHGTRMGIYLDNFTSNYFVYRNVVWNIRGCDIRLNKPSLHNVVINNTMLGNTRNWGRWKTDWMYGCAYVNNAVSGTIMPHPQAAFAHNRFNIPADELNPDTVHAAALDHGNGLEIPGITGPNPGIGAYEAGATWRPGHDFSKSPPAEYRPADTPLRNLVKHGSFDWVQWRGKLGPWNATGNASATVFWGNPGGISNSYTGRDTIIGAGVRLDGDAPDGIEQIIGGLRPEQAYEVGAWVKVRDGAALTLKLETTGMDTVEVTATNAESWQRLAGRFTTGTQVGEATLHISRTGPGTAFVDDVSLVGIIEAIEPRLPGFAPVAEQPPPTPIQPRHQRPLPVPKATVKPVVDGIRSDNEYPGPVIEVADRPSRTPVAGAPCHALLSHADGILFVAVTVPVTEPLTVEANPVWTRADGAEICFSYPDDNANHPVFVLHGFPNGLCESSTEAGAPKDAAKRLLDAVQYAASVTADQWTAEWAIPLEAADIETAPGLQLDFNIGVFRREKGQWIQWGGTKAQTWRVERAGKIRLAP